MNRRAKRLTATAAIAFAATVFATSTGAIAQQPTTPPVSPSAPSSAPSTPNVPTTPDLPTTPPAQQGSDLESAPKDVLKDPQGVVTQVVPKEPVPAPPGTPAEAPAAAQAQAETVEKVFGADPVGELVVDRVLPVGEDSTVRLCQEIGSVPVYGASVAQSLSADGALISVTGALTQKSEGEYPGDAAVPPAEASATATAAIAAETGQPADQLTVEGAESNWYEPKLASVADAASVAVPAYRVTVVKGGEAVEDGEEVAWTVFVDANDTARVLDKWSETKHIDRVVCDAARKRVSLSNSSVRCGGTSAMKLTRTEGQGPVAIADVNNIYDFLGDTSEFYTQYTALQDLTDLIGFDTGDGNGKALRATVRVCTYASGTDPGCPYTNAFWNSEQMAYGEGVSTDDITGHELTHGVSERVNGLVYRNESGAINESMSDIFGEFTDLTNGSADDTPQNRWKLGEGSSLGVIRDMNNPGALGDPDTYRGPNWYSGTNQSAFVHINGGVGNKAAQLITDGGSLNGEAVTGIGLEKAAQLYYTAQTLLSSNATYSTLGSTLATACRTNVQNNVAGTTAADCAQVVKATKAVKMPSLNQSA
ncbi:M4 family metallopeptidase [Nocardia crassostreae]|uniref:M4 family metallopeptidase n=1 Tax=Nocardia crassostreae TaxID=53428 RepID=UPI001470A1E8|nr:M4 family metallopeptidase [Nocardia crassostreae]